MTTLTIFLMTHMKETSIWEASFEEAVSGSLEDEDQWGKQQVRKTGLSFFNVILYQSITTAIILTFLY